VGEVPPNALNLNVDGRRLVGPVQGFGRLWQKTYKVDLSGVDVAPADVIATWRQRFGSFWPPHRRFYRLRTAMAPGDVFLLNAVVPGGVTVCTGVLVLYADETSFTFMTPQGHLFAAWITFSATQDSGGGTIAQIEVLARADDPFYELCMPMGLSRLEDGLWQRTLTNLARHFGVDAPIVSTTVRCLDRRRQWSRAGNIWYNAAIRSALYGFALRLRSFL
jgi:hypothetical protein